MNTKGVMIVASMLIYAGSAGAQSVNPSSKQYRCKRITRGQVIELNGEAGPVENDSIDIERSELHQAGNIVTIEKSRSKKYGFQTQSTNKTITAIKPIEGGIEEVAVVEIVATQWSQMQKASMPDKFESKYESKVRFKRSEDDTYRAVSMEVDGKSVPVREMKKTVIEGVVTTELVHPRTLEFGTSGRSYRQLEDVETCELK